MCIGRSTEIEQPGEYIVRDLAGESIFLVRNLQGELRGFYNVCSHRGTKFLDDCEGTGQAKKAFKCPYHAWSFDLDGNLIASPNVHEDDAFDRSDYPLYGFAVDEYAGFLFVNLTKGPVRPLLDALLEGAETITAYERYRMDELRLGPRIVYEVKANWKIVVENYNECLHCPQIHPELVSVIPLYRFGEVWDDDSGRCRQPDGGRGDELQRERQVVAAAAAGPRSGRLPHVPGQLRVPQPDGEPAPGRDDGYIAMPKGPNHTTVISEFFYRPETIAAPDFDPSGMVEFWDLVSKQDWAVVERAQTGVSSRAFTRGVFPRQDRFLYWFNEEWRTRMGRERIG